MYRKKVETRVKLFTLLLAGIGLLINCSYPEGAPGVNVDSKPIARFIVEPGLTVATGEEVYFDAGAGNYYPFSTANKFEWDFGDGYTLKGNYPFPYIKDDGIACTHFYLKPGEYTVTLVVTSRTGKKDLNSQTIKVTGPARTGYLDLLHANFHGRIAQYLYVGISELARSKGVSMATFTLELTDSAGNSYLPKSEIFSGSVSGVLSGSQRIRGLLYTGKLPQGSYVLAAKMKTGNTVLDEIREKFTKPYNGIPHVGINENNAVCIDNKPFFPVTPFLMNKNNTPNWANKYINCVFGISMGDYSKYNDKDWGDYLNFADSLGLHAIGPTNWDGLGQIRQYERNSDMKKLADMVGKNRDNPAMLMWTWDDEPNLGGWNQYTPAPVVRAWTYKTHQLDPQHLVIGALYGYDWLPYYIDNNNSFDADRFSYLYDASQFGGRRTFPADLITFDIFPLEDSLNYGIRWDNGANNSRFHLYAEAIDNMVNRNGDLIPVMAVVEARQYAGGIGMALTAAQCSSPEQLQMETWMHVVHKMKGISWFYHQAQFPPTGHLPIMEKFLRQVTALADVILGPETGRAVTDNADGDPLGNPRVDTMLREDTGNVWIFAVRVTETNGETVPGDSSVTFNVSGLSASTVTVYDEARTIPMAGGSFSDNFAQCAVHIYRIPK